MSRTCPHETQRHVRMMTSAPMVIQCSSSRVACAHARYVACNNFVTTWMVERSNMSVTCPIPVGAWMLNSLQSFFVLYFIIAIYSLLSSILSLCNISIFISFKSLFLTHQLVYDESLALCSRGTRFKSRLMSCLSWTRFLYLSPVFRWEYPLSTAPPPKLVLSHHL
jgi:hypothetical protein